MRRCFAAALATSRLRELARDYDVQHTTLSRHFARPEAARELKRVKRLIQAEQREAEADRRADERAERTARRRVKQQPAQASRTTEPPAAAAGEAQPAQPGAGKAMYLSRRPLPAQVGLVCDYRGELLDPCARLPHSNYTILLRLPSAGWGSAFASDPDGVEGPDRGHELDPPPVFVRPRGGEGVLRGRGLDHRSTP